MGRQKRRGRFGPVRRQKRGSTQKATPEVRETARKIAEIVWVCQKCEAQYSKSKYSIGKCLMPNCDGTTFRKDVRNPNRPVIIPGKTRKITVPQTFYKCDSCGAIYLGNHPDTCTREYGYSWNRRKCGSNSFTQKTEEVEIAI